MTTSDDTKYQHTTRFVEHFVGQDNVSHSGVLVADPAITEK